MLGQQEELDELFRYAETALHANALGEILKKWLTDAETINQGIQKLASEGEQSEHPEHSRAR